MIENITLNLNREYALADEQVDFFKRHGFIKLKNVLSQETLDYYGREITNKVLALNSVTKPMTERTTYERAFLQVTNLWRRSKIVSEFVHGKALAGIVTQLLETDGVRLYHDQALYKEAGGGFTPWHADQYYWPLATDKTCTAWIPLQETPVPMGPLAFSARSHKFENCRDFKISDESETQIEKALLEKGFEQIEEPFALGEVSFHYGWTFHRAGPNITETPRKVMTIIYMDKNMRLQLPANDNQKVDRDVFCPGINVGEVVNSELNPVLYDRAKLHTM